MGEVAWIEEREESGFSYQVQQVQQMHGCHHQHGSSSRHISGVVPKTDPFSYESV